MTTPEPRPTVYLDATVPSYLFDERADIAFHVQATRTRLGLHVPIITTPFQLVEED